MATPTFTKTGSKATTAATLDKSVFAVEVPNHQLLKDAYVAHLANGRVNLAVAKTRGEVSGGGKKPWKQKGTGRARFGSSRVPIWRGGGITFGPTGQENYAKKLNIKAKRTAIRQALSLANQDGSIVVLESFENKDLKAKVTAALFNKLGLDRTILFVVADKTDDIHKATRNVANLSVVQAQYLNVFDILNAHHIVLTKDSLPLISQWLGDTPKSSRTSGDKS